MTRRLMIAALLLGAERVLPQFEALYAKVLADRRPPPASDSVAIEP